MLLSIIVSDYVMQVMDLPLKTLLLISKAADNKSITENRDHMNKSAKTKVLTVVYQKANYQNQSKKQSETPKMFSAQDGACFKKELIRLRVKRSQQALLRL